MRSKTFCVLIFYRIRYELLLQDRDEGRGFIALGFCGISAECYVLIWKGRKLCESFLFFRCLRDKRKADFEKACQMAKFLLIYRHSPAVHVQLSYFEPTPLHRESEPVRDAHASSEERRNASRSIPPAFMQSQNKAITTWWGWKPGRRDAVSRRFYDG